MRDFTTFDKLAQILETFLQAQRERKRREEELNHLKRIKMDEIMEQCREEKEKLDKEFGKRT
jgi:hypothetical protein